MECLDSGLVQIGDALLVLVSLASTALAVGSGLLKLFADALPKLCSGGLGEGNGSNLVEGGSASGDHVDHPIDETSGLTGTGAGLDEEGVLQVVGDNFPGLLVTGLEGCQASHGCSSSPSASSRYRDTRGSCFFRSQRSARREGQMVSKSQ